MANSYVSESDVRFWEGGNYTLLENYANRVKVIPSGFNSAQTVTPSSAQFILLDNTHITAGTIKKDTVAENLNNGVICAPLAGAVGAAALTTLTNSLGQVINLVEIVDPDTNDPILDNGDRVWGLIQCASTANNGDAIGAPASENVQISFVKYDNTDSLVLVTLNQSIQFSVKRGYSERHISNYSEEGKAVPTDVIETVVPKTLQAYYEVTADFEAGETLTLSTGAGSVSGTSTLIGTAPVLPASGAAFKSNGNVQFSKGGKQEMKGAGGGDSNDVDWASTNTVVLNKKYKTGEVIMVESQDVYV